jgi:site-specific DNA recombinase
MRGGVAKRNSSNHERPRKEWIEIPVPAIINEETFAIAQELLTANKTHAPRRTIEPSICQGMVSCSKCGYALYRTSTRSSARKIHYYRCLGSDAWRHLNGAVCSSRPVRQDLLDHVVWNEVVRLLENPRLIEEELNRRLEAAQNAAPTRRRRETLERDLTRVRKSVERLMTAYQEDLLSLDELRSRLPELRQRERAMHAELQSIGTQEQDRAAYLRLAETLSAFLGRLRSSAETLDVLERQRIVRLLVKEVLVSDDAIVIRHSIPVTARPPRDEEPPRSTPSGVSEAEGYLLRSGRNHRPLRSATRATYYASIFDNADLQRLRNQTEDALVRDTVLEETDDPAVASKKDTTDYPACPGSGNRHPQAPRVRWPGTGGDQQHQATRRVARARHPAERPNPHSARGTRVPHHSREPSLEAFGRRPRVLAQPLRGAGIRSPSQ